MSGNGNITTVKYVLQTIKCGPNGDTADAGSGLAEVSSTTEVLSSLSNCNGSSQNMEQ